jgi:hypothetical protein
MNVDILTTPESGDQAAYTVTMGSLAATAAVVTLGAPRLGDCHEKEFEQLEHQLEQPEPQHEQHRAAHQQHESPTCHHGSSNAQLACQWIRGWDPASHPTLPEMSHPTSPTRTAVLTL